MQCANWSKRWTGSAPKAKQPRTPLLQHSEVRGAITRTSVHLRGLMRAVPDDAALITVADALAAVLATIEPLPVERIPLLSGLGRVLAETVIAQDHVPPFRNSAMDGYAVHAADIATATSTTPTQLLVVGTGPAGYPAVASVGPGQAVRIMTGAPLPPGADTVVRFEDTDEVEQANSSNQEYQQLAIRKALPVGVNVREAGEDIRAGTTVLPAGTVLRPVEIGLLAALGHATIAVHRQPTVAILATGDEVVDLDVTPAPGQIRNSNSYTLAALVQRYGGKPQLLGVARDSLDDLVARLALAHHADLILSSGGVSVGDYDMVKDVLRAEGEIVLWQVQMKPGKPLAFGRLSQKPFLGLPGNPVAAYVSFEVFARPALLRLLGHSVLTKPAVFARTTTEVPNQGGRRHFVRANVFTGGDAGLLVEPTGEQGSGVLTALRNANALLVIPDECERLAAGAVAEVLLLHHEQGSTLPETFASPIKPGD